MRIGQKLKFLQHGTSRGWVRPVTARDGYRKFAVCHVVRRSRPAGVASIGGQTGKGGGGGGGY